MQAMVAAGAGPYSSMSKCAKMECSPSLANARVRGRRRYLRYGPYDFDAVHGVLPQLHSHRMRDVVADGTVILAVHIAKMRVLSLAKETPQRRSS